MEMKPIYPPGTSHIPFKGYIHPLKTLYKKGLFPSVTRGLYGEPLTPDGASLEHLLCHSNGGKTTYRNLALASKDRNSARGNRPLADFLTWEMLEEYLSQFNFRIRGLFDGYAYQRQLRQTCESLGIKAPEEVKEKIIKQKLPKKILRSMRNKSKKGLDITG